MFEPLAPEWWWSYILDGMLIFHVIGISRKKAWGWPIGTVFNAGWVTYALVTHQYGFLPMSVIMIGVTIKNFINWRREETNE